MSNLVESEIQKLLENLGTNPDRGLSEVEAYNRLHKFGTNELERPYLLFQKIRFVVLFCCAMAILLLAEGATYYALGTALSGILLEVAAFFLRKRYKQAIATSFNQTPLVCLGIRGGKLLQLPVYKLVPGDIVRLKIGDIIPADGRLIEAVNLVVQEKTLSGNANCVEKDALQQHNPLLPHGDNKSRVFMSTAVIRGRGTFVVTETGTRTLIGKAKGVACH